MLPLLHRLLHRLPLPLLYYTATSWLLRLLLSDLEWKTRFEEDFEKGFNIPYMRDFFRDAVSYPSNFCLGNRNPQKKKRDEGRNNKEKGLDAFLILSKKKVGFGLGKFMGNGLHTLRSNLFYPKKVLQSWDPTLIPGSMLPAMLTTMLFSPSWFDLLELDNLTGGFVRNLFVKYLGNFIPIADISCSFILKAHKRKGTALNMRKKGQPPTDPVTLTAEEKLNVTLKRDDGFSNFDVQGTF
ncbi:hypothetical protein L2E82_25441 [Cichorium intybus]|uniref:Uncharacterized protein n=1 Tax=Cichorium intybus TaxID=13427 RepID=A0ACB9E375_CICIN|nr:hypothetical protein L2E82_25441 [Cichorium intybus]